MNFLLQSQYNVMSISLCVSLKNLENKYPKTKLSWTKGLLITIDNKCIYLLNYIFKENAPENGYNLFQIHFNLNKIVNCHMHLYSLTTKREILVVYGQSNPVI